MPLTAGVQLIMPIYRYVADSDSFACIAPKGPKDRKAIDSLYDDKPKAKKWTPARVSLDVSQGKLGDFPSLYGGIPVFSERAWEILQPLLLGCVEALPLILPTHRKYYAIHVLDVVNALDTEKSVLDYFPNGSVMDIEKIVFKKNAIQNKHMFKLPEKYSSDVYLSDYFKKTVDGNKLKGIEFDKVA